MAYAFEIGIVHYVPNCNLAFNITEALHPLNKQKLPENTACYD
jgi:hypothetical protein